MNQVTSGPSRKAYESTSSVMNSGTYFRGFSTNNLMSSKYRHLNVDNHFIDTESRKYEAVSGQKEATAGRRRILPVTTLHLFSSSQIQLGTSNKNVYNEGCKTRYAPPHSTGSNRSHSNGKNNRSPNITQRSDIRPDNTRAMSKNWDREFQGSALWTQQLPTKGIDCE